MQEITIFTGALSGPKQFLATEKPLKMMKNVFYFTLEVLFVLQTFKSFDLAFSSHRKTA